MITTEKTESAPPATPRDWNTAPPLDLEMPSRWPKFTDATRRLLVDWGLRQSNVCAWVMVRIGKYAATNSGLSEIDFEPCACLEAFQWQRGGVPARAAVEWLKCLAESANQQNKPKEKDKS